MKRQTLEFEALENRVVLNVGPVLVQEVTDQNWQIRRFSDTSARVRSLRLQTDGVQDGTVLGVADFNADGIDDVLLQWPDGSLHLQVNDGKQLYELPWGDGPTTRSDLLAMADMNGDSLADVVSFDRETGDIWVSINSRQGFRSAVWSNFTPKADWQHLFVDDFNGDGSIDVLGGEASGGWWLAQNVGTTFHNLYWGLLSKVAWQDVVSGDFTGDGIADVSARAPDNTWWTWTGAQGGFASPSYWGHWKMRNAWVDVHVGDFNGDNRDDLISRTEDGRLWVGTAKDTHFHTWSWGTGWVHRADWTNVKAVDLNGDGLPDQLGRAKDNTWWYAENLGGRFANRYWTRGSGNSHLSLNFESQQPLNLFDTFQAYVNDDLSTETVGAFANEPDQSPVSVTVNEQGFLVLVGKNVPLVGVDFQSPSGSLIPTSNASRLSESQPLSSLPVAGAEPFQFFLENLPRQVTMGIITEPAILNGTVTLNVGWDFSTGAADLRGSWGGPEFDGALDVDDRLDGGSSIDLLDSNESFYNALWERFPQKFSG